MMIHKQKQISRYIQVIPDYCLHGTTKTVVWWTSRLEDWDQFWARPLSDSDLGRLFTGFSEQVHRRNEEGSPEMFSKLKRTALTKALKSIVFSCHSSNDFMTKVVSFHVDVSH